MTSCSAVGWSNGLGSLSRIAVSTYVLVLLPRLISMDVLVSASSNSADEMGAVKHIIAKLVDNKVDRTMFLLHMISYWNRYVFMD